jgi:hypothetical protein
MDGHSASVVTFASVVWDLSNASLFAMPSSYYDWTNDPEQVLYVPLLIQALR